MIFRCEVVPTFAIVADVSMGGSDGTGFFSRAGGAGKGVSSSSSIGIGGTALVRVVGATEGNENRDALEERKEPIPDPQPERTALASLDVLATLAGRVDTGESTDAIDAIELLEDKVRGF
jgi:hypothetical protein